MKSILQELYMGNVGFDSWQYAKDSPFVNAAQRKMDNMKALTDTLNDAQKKLFEGYIGAQGDMEHITRYDTYVATLKFGMLLMGELLGGGVGEQHTLTPS